MSSIYYTLFMAFCLVGLGDFFVSVFEKRKIQVNKWIHLALYGIGVAGIYGNSILFLDFAGLRILTGIIIISAYQWLLYRENIAKLLLWVLLYYGVVGITEFFGTLLFQWMIPNFVALNSTEGDSWSVWLLAIFCQLVLFLIIVILKETFKKQGSIRLTASEWIRFSCFPMFTIIILAAIFIRFEVIQQEKMEHVYLLVSIGLLLMNILIYTLIHDISKREAQLQADKLFRERVENETKMYHSISENYAQQQRREHEYKNQLMCITALTNDKKYEELIQYLQGLNQSFMSCENVLDTNHVIANAILNSKYKEARDKGILMTVILSDLSQIGIADEDLVTILSNLLNNAIEACEDCEKKIIKLKIDKEEKGLLISVSNTYKHPPIKVGDKFQTTKTQDAGNHGIGIENIKAVIAKYDGICVVQYDEEEFHFVIQIHNCIKDCH